MIYVEKNAFYGMLRNFKCSECDVIFCPDMDEVISPDYVDIEINAEHIWLQSHHKNKAFHQYLDILNTHNVRPGLVVDYGCGTGGFLRYLVNHDTSIKYYGFDFSLKEINTAKSLDQIAHYAESRSLDAALKDIAPLDDVSILTMWDVLEHIRRPKEFCEDLRAFDYIYISVPSAEFQILKYKFSRMFGEKPYFMSHEHVTYFSRKSLKLLIESLGFTVLKEINVEKYERKQKSPKNVLRDFFYDLFARAGYPPQIGILASRK